MMERALISFNYGLILIYGVLLSADFSGGIRSRKQRRLTLAMIVVALALQLICSRIFGMAFTQKIYPLLSHLPLVLVLVFGFKRKASVSVVAVFTAYFCCQLPRWLGSVASLVLTSRIPYLLVYAVSIPIFYIILRRYFVVPLYEAMTYSPKAVYHFGGLPVLYYFFDYATTVYTDLLYQGVRMIAEFLPVTMALFYIVFVVIHHQEVQEKGRIELERSVLAMKLSQREQEIAFAKESEAMMRIYRHDLHHHLALIGKFAADDNMQKIREYLVSTRAEIDAVTPQRYCENETVNLILSSFAAQAKQAGVVFCADADLPEGLSVGDTELCALFSNALENAIAAAREMEDEKLRRVYLRALVNDGKLVISTENAYMGTIAMEGELPRSKRAESGHGFGLKSITAIVERHGGLYSIETASGIFILQLMLPLA